MIQNKITKIRKYFNKFNIDGYIVPKNDQFFSEYSEIDRLKLISNFSGSAGFAVILKNKNYLFIDGRYTIQAKQQSGKKFSIIEIHKYFPYSILKYHKNLSLGFDPKLFTSSTLKTYFKNKFILKPIEENLVDKVSKQKKNNNKKSFYSLNNQIVGENVFSKINKIVNYLKKIKSDNLFISAPENVAWALNIRGRDNPHSPIPNCQMVITQKKKIYLFVKKEKIKAILKKIKIHNIKIFNPNKFFNLIKILPGKKFSIDYLSCSIFNEKIIRNKFKINNYKDPCYYFKSIKNSFEINNMIKSHIIDGVALTKFIYWIKKNNKNNLTEILAQKKLEKFRKMNKKYLFPSFNTIAGTGSNGAIVHYRATKYSNKKINKKDIFLCDSGGQYKYGTTDVTRTICFKKQTSEIKNNFTRVLKGHIAVATSNLSKSSTGKIIDKKARIFLNKAGLDYAHGTGHGVGFFLNVHEGPQSISKYNNIKLKEGMIVSNEPGFYKKGKYGIRIENLVYVKKENNKLYFKNLTLAPIEKDLINYNLLNNKEKNYLFEYHLLVYSKISMFLNNNEKKWLASFI
tara:strand:+ start:489 stop:2198 length:1710 start_codon:yes stop_codon:yes gene_type:complete